MVNFLLIFHWLPMVFNAGHYQDLYNTYMTVSSNNGIDSNIREIEIVETVCFLCKEKGYHMFRIVDKEYFLCNTHYAKYNDPTYNVRTH
jgi:hypothetical protein